MISLELCGKVIFTKEDSWFRIYEIFSFRTHIGQLGEHQKHFHIIFSKKTKNFTILELYKKYPPVWRVFFSLPSYFGAVGAASKSNL